MKGTNMKSFVIAVVIVLGFAVSASGQCAACAKARITRAGVVKVVEAPKLQMKKRQPVRNAMKGVARLASRPFRVHRHR